MAFTFLHQYVGTGVTPVATQSMSQDTGGYDCGSIGLVYKLKVLHFHRTLKTTPESPESK
jgi:hypothetical protein